MIRAANMLEYEQWCVAAHEHSELALPDGALLGISAMLGIYRAVAQMLPEPEVQRNWVHRALLEYPFPGRPIDYMTKGLTELIEMRVWLSELADSLYP